MSDQVCVLELTEQYLEETAALLVRSFLSLNDIWKQYNLAYEQVFPIIRAKLIPTVPGYWSFVTPNLI